MITKPVYPLIFYTSIEYLWSIQLSYAWLMLVHFFSLSAQSLYVGVDLLKDRYTEDTSKEANGCTIGGTFPSGLPNLQRQLEGRRGSQPTRHPHSWTELRFSFRLRLVRWLTSTNRLGLVSLPFFPWSVTCSIQLASSPAPVTRRCVIW